MCNTLSAKILYGCFCRAEQDARNMIRRDSIDLFGHPSIKTAKARLQMSNLDMQLCGAQSSRQGGIRISVNHYDIWLFCEKHLLDLAQHCPCLCALRPRSHLEVVVRVRQL